MQSVPSSVSRNVNTSKCVRLRGGALNTDITFVIIKMFPPLKCYKLHCLQSAYCVLMIQSRGHALDNLCQLNTFISADTFVVFIYHLPVGYY